MRFAASLLTFIFSTTAFAADPAAEPASKGMTLWQILHAGGAVMVVLGVLSLILLFLVTFLFLYLDPKKLVPQDLSRECAREIRNKKYEHARKMLTGNESIIKTIIFSGLDRVSIGEEAVQESLELTARKEVTGLWSWLNYISDIGQVAPMLGLLGNVLGMIRAFNTIAFETGVVKPIVLAGGIAEAMITTAGGLSIGILSMVLYPVIRARVQNITNLLETETSVLIKAFSHDKT